MQFDPNAISAKVILFSSIIAFIFTKLHWIDIPLDRDEGTYLYLGKCFAEGYRPYIDFYEIKPPGVFVVYALFHKVFGFNNVTLHIGLAIIQALTSYFIFYTTKKLLSSHQSGIVSACVFLIFCLSPLLLSFGLNSEVFIIFFMVWSWYHIFRYQETSMNKHLVYSGFLIAVSILIRQQAILFLFPYLVLGLTKIAQTKNNYWRSWLIIIEGGLLFTIPLLIYVIIHGSFTQMIYWVLERPFSFYLDNIPWSRGREVLLHFIKSFSIENLPLLTLVFIGILFIYIPNQVSIKTKIFLGVLLLTSLMAIVPGYRFFPHYWIYILPFLSMCSSGISSFFQIKNSTNFVPTFVAVIIIFQLLYNHKNYFTKPAIETYTNIYGSNPNIAVEKVTKHLQKIMNPDDKLYVFGSEPQVYYQCNHIPNLRHVYVAFAFQPIPSCQPFQEEILKYLIAEKPTYIFHVQNSLSVLLHPKSSKILYEGIFQIEESNYEPILFAKIKEDNNVMMYYGTEAAQQSIFEKNYIVLYKRKVINTF